MECAADWGVNGMCGSIVRMGRADGASELIAWMGRADEVCG